MKRFKRFAHVAVASVVFAITVMSGGVARAALVEQDLFVSGDGLLTLDDATGSDGSI